MKKLSKHSIGAATAAGVCIALLNAVPAIGQEKASVEKGIMDTLVNVQLVNPVLSELLHEVASQVQLQKGYSLNIVYDGFPGDIPVPEVRADQVTVANLLLLLQHLLDIEIQEIDSNPEDLEPGFILVRQKAPPEEPSPAGDPFSAVEHMRPLEILTRAYFVEGLGPEVTQDQIVEHITDFWELDDEKAVDTATIRFHPDTGTMLIRANEEQHRQVAEMLEILAIRARLEKPETPKGE